MWTRPQRAGEFRTSSWAFHNGASVERQPAWSRQRPLERREPRALVGRQRDEPSTLNRSPNAASHYLACWCSCRGYTQWCGASATDGGTDRGHGSRAFSCQRRRSGRPRAAPPSRVAGCGRAGHQRQGATKPAPGVGARPRRGPDRSQRRRDLLAERFDAFKHRRLTSERCWQARRGMATPRRRRGVLLA
jgi:hypothetical protein